MAKCLLVLLNSPITLTLLRWGLERFPTLSTLSLHPYGKTVSSFFFILFVYGIEYSAMDCWWNGIFFLEYLLS